VDQKFIQLVDLLENEPRLYADKAFSYIRENINFGNNKEDFVNFLREKSKNSTNPILMAVFYFTLARCQFIDQIDNSLKNLDEALKYIMSVHDYQKLDLYYYILSTKVVYYNIQGNLFDSFILSTKAITQLAPGNNINALCAFDVNLSYIANELGYPEQGLLALDSFKENRKYLSNYVRIQLSKAYLLTYSNLKKFDLYLNEIEKLKKSDLSEKNVDIAYLNYYVYKNNLSNATKYKDILEEKYLTDKLNFKLESHLYLSLARYYYLAKDYEKSYKYYYAIINNRQYYFGQSIKVLKEYLKLLYALKKYDLAFEVYEKIEEISDTNRKILMTIVSDTSFKEYALIDENYQNIMARMDDVTAFLNEAVRNSDTIYLLNRFYGLIDKFCPNSKLRIVIRKKDGLYKFEKGYRDFKKFKSVHALDVFNGKPLTHVSPLMRHFTDGYNHVYPMRHGDYIDGYVLFDDKFLSYQDDTTKNVAIEVVSALFNAFRNNQRIEELVKSSRLDPLTKTYNRQALDSYLKNFNYNHTYLIEIDIDDFKGVNDTYGHPAGDDVLKKLASLLKKYFNDSVFRVGGEEFIIISSLRKDEILTRFNELNSTLKKSPMIYANKEIPITISFGGVIINSYKDFKNAYVASDKILYEMKKDGKDKGKLE